MVFALFTLMTALAMSALAAWFSIEGLVAIYAGMSLKVMLLAGGVEACKLVAASWVYQSWDWSRAWVRMTLSGFVVGVMVVTSIGIFGLLNKAHQDTVAKSDTDVQKIERIDTRIAAEQSKIARLNMALGQLDKSIQVYFDKEFITRGLREREKQKDIRADLNNTIDEHNANIDKLIDEQQPLIKKVKDIQNEIGPLKAVAELVYGEDNAESYFDDVLRWLTILLVAIFDPFAVTLIIAANMSIKRAQRGHEDDHHILDKVVNHVKKKEPELVKAVVNPAPPVKSHKIVAKSPVEFNRQAPVDDAIITNNEDNDWFDKWLEKPENGPVKQKHNQKITGKNK